MISRGIKHKWGIIIIGLALLGLGFEKGNAACDVQDVCKRVGEKKRKMNDISASSAQTSPVSQPEPTSPTSSHVAVLPKKDVEPILDDNLVKEIIKDCKTLESTKCGFRDLIEYCWDEDMSTKEVVSQCGAN